MSQVKPIPDGYHALTPSLVVPDSVEAIGVYKKVFDAEQIELIKAGGRVIHAEVRIGNSVLMMADENPDWDLKSPATVGGTANSLYHYVEDVDAVNARALENGFTASNGHVLGRPVLTGCRSFRPYLESGNSR